MRARTRVVGVVTHIQASKHISSYADRAVQHGRSGEAPIAAVAEAGRVQGVLHGLHRRKPGSTTNLKPAVPVPATREMMPFEFTRRTV